MNNNNEDLFQEKMVFVCRKEIYPHFVKPQKNFHYIEIIVFLTSICILLKVLKTFP